MKVSMCKTMRTYDWKNLSKDLLAGLVIMAVSIPISMGYAQIAGLPAVYGLYGSVFPIVLFALFHPNNMAPNIQLKTMIILFLFITCFLYMKFMKEVIHVRIRG